MKTHLSDGQLRAALDGELDLPARRHLESCAACQARQRALGLRTAEIAQRLSFLSGAAPHAAPSPQAGFQRFHDHAIPQKETNMLKQLFRSGAVRALAALTLLVLVVVSVPSARALADQILSLFRVQQVTVIPIDASGLQQLAGDETLGKQISQLVSSSVLMSEKPGDPQPAADAADASRQAGFTVRLPQGRAPSRLSVEGKAAFAFTVDRSKAQALLDEAGRSDLILPESMDGAVIKVAVPASVRADYGACPDPAQAGSAGAGSAGRNYPDCVIFAQLPSPTVEAPAGVDVPQLAQMALEFTGMSPEQARAFSQSVDWTSTLVIPVPGMPAPTSRCRSTALRAR